MKRLVLALAFLVAALGGCKRSQKPNEIPPTPPEHVNPSPDALARKARSEALLTARSIRVNPHLPVIDDEREVKLRTKDEAVDRALALMVVAGRAEGAPSDAVEGMVERLGAASFFTPKEQAFLRAAEPPDADKQQLVWRYEALAVLEWAVGASPELPDPSQPANIEDLVRHILEPGAAAFRAHAKLRSATEILDQTDLAYRYHWACVDAHLRHERGPAAPICDVVQERHYVLNWLTRYGDLAWDDVRTDT